MVHLDAAYNLAHWLVRDSSAAEDVVQEALLRAFRYFESFRGGDARPWLMGIVRNAAYTWLRERGDRSISLTERPSIAKYSTPSPIPCHVRRRPDVLGLKFFRSWNSNPRQSAEDRRLRFRTNHLEAAS